MKILEPYFEGIKPINVNTTEFPLVSAPFTSLRNKTEAMCSEDFPHSGAGIIFATAVKLLQIN